MSRAAALRSTRCTRPSTSRGGWKFLVFVRNLDSCEPYPHVPYDCQELRFGKFSFPKARTSLAGLLISIRIETSVRVDVCVHCVVPVPVAGSSSTSWFDDGSKTPGRTPPGHTKDTPVRRGGAVLCRPRGWHRGVVAFTLFCTLSGRAYPKQCAIPTHWY